MKFAYYPGCAGETTALEYSRSAVEVFRLLNIQLEELKDWSCCGASSGHSVNYELSHGLAGRNLAIAEEAGLDTAVICPACFVRLKDTLESVRSGRLPAEKIKEMTGRPFSGSRNVRHILEIIMNDAGPDAVKKLVKKPLTGLKTACYYGCYLVRPRELTGFDDPENPVLMDMLLSALGADVVDWSGKTDCCGGSGSFTDRAVASKMAAGITGAAREAGAEILVCGCGLCQANVEARQPEENPMPVVYFTELMALAFGLGRKWLDRHMVSPAPVLDRLGL